MTNKGIVRWILRLTVAAMCIGHAWWLWMVEETPLMSWIHSPTDVGGWDFSESLALRVQTGIAVFLTLTAVATFFRTYPLLLGLVSLIQLAIATAMWRMGGGFQIVSPWIPSTIASLLPFSSQAARVAAPLALALYDCRNREPSILWEHIARWGTALAFVGHGLEALWHAPGFIDLILFSAFRAGIEISESIAKILLTWIGIIDLLLALLLISRRWRLAAIYAAFWGFVTACSRVTAFGFDLGWFEVLIRAAHFGLPTALAVYWWHRPTAQSAPAEEPPASQ